MDAWKFEEMYRRVQQFSLDEPDAILPFSQKLAKENGWTAQYTQRVMIEYKKFMVLAAIVDHPVTPSEQVDQVWHLHLTYTHSYWDKFCGETLRKPLHHCPTRGGISEYEKFYRWYSDTLISYEKFFNQLPPPDIWAPPDIRLNQGRGFTRINTQAYWLMPKPSFQFLHLPKLSLPKSSLVKLSAIALLLLFAALNLYPIAFPIISVIAYPNPTVDLQLATTQIVEINSDLPTILIYQNWRTKTLIILSGMFFIIAIAQFLYYKILIKIPVFIAPVGGSKFQSKHSSHDEEIGVVHSLIGLAFMNGFLALILILLLSMPLDLQLSVFFLLIATIIGSIIYFISLYTCFIWKTFRRSPVEELFRINGHTISSKYLAQLKRDHASIRPLHCKNCKQPLREVSGSLPLESSGFSKPQIVAAEINDVSFQMWHCSQCYAEINRQTVHLYTLGSYKSRSTTYCPNCKVRTMRITYKFLTPATVDREGKGMQIFTCVCCGRKDEKIHTIPKELPPEPSDSDLGCGVCGI